ncbi:hypothetical protein D3C80_1798720 [compost metagenome]
MQQETVDGQQHHDQDFRLKLGIEEVLGALDGVIHQDNADPCCPEYSECKKYGLLQCFKMVFVAMSIVFSLNQLLDHGKVTGQDQTNCNAARNQVGINNTHAH